MNNPIRVLVVDDSALARRMLSDMLNQHPKIEVVGTAQDGQFVLSRIQELRPDVITLDVEMRNVGGLEILPKIVNQFQLPVIMVSAHTDRGAEATLRALEMGAVDFVTKPQAIGTASVQTIGEILAQKIAGVAGSKIRPVRPRTTQPSVKPKTPAARKPEGTFRSHAVDVIAIGSSTGGPEAVKDVLIDLPNTLPGIVIAQHMPAGFTRTFADRLNTLCQIHVKEAEDGDEIAPGMALIAPGSHHLVVTKRGMRYVARLLDTQPVNRHKPSVDVLYYSVAEQCRNRSMGIILTGMGADGAAGLKAMFDMGAITAAQDEQSCVVFGMPKEAIKLGGACHILSLQDIPGFILATLAKNSMKLASVGS